MLEGRTGTTDRLRLLQSAVKLLHLQIKHSPLDIDGNVDADAHTVIMNNVANIWKLILIIRRYRSSLDEAVNGHSTFDLDFVSADVV